MGEYDDPLRVVAFNTTEHWAEDVAREILRRVDLAGDELPSCLEGFIARHVGPDPHVAAGVGPGRAAWDQHFFDPIILPGGRKLVPGIEDE